MMAPMLVCTDVTVRFGGLTAVDAVSLTLAFGEILGVIGPNGAGKSTLLNAITGLYPPSAGTITFRDRRLNGVAPHRIVARGIARTFQSSRLFEDLSVLDNVVVGMHSRTRTGVIEAILLPNRARHELAEATARAEQLILSVSEALHEQRHRPAGELAQADRRRLEIARALASAPDLLLLDEPSSGMDDKETEALVADLRRLQAKTPERAIVIVEHDMKLVAALPDRVVVLDYGRKIAEGTFDEVRQLERVQEAYLGRSHAHS